MITVSAYAHSPEIRIKKDTQTMSYRLNVRKKSGKKLIAV